MLTTKYEVPYYIGIIHTLCYTYPCCFTGLVCWIAKQGHTKGMLANGEDKECNYQDVQSSIPFIQLGFTMANKHNRYYAKNRERINARRRAQYNTDPSKFKASMARYYRNNKESRKAYVKAWYYTNPSKAKAQNLRRYGLSVEQFNNLLEQQGYRCAICKQPNGKGTNKSRQLAVDHNHVTGKNRGLLCTNCNTSLGGFKDDILYLEAAIRYLQTYLY